MALLNRLACATLMAAMTAVGQARAEPVMVAHPSCPVTTLTSEQARRMLLAEELSWSNGDVTQLVEVMAEDAAVRAGYLAIARKTVSQVHSEWNRQVFAGRANPPLRAQSAAEARALVARLPGAFAVIDSSAVDATVKIIFRAKAGG